MTTTQFPAGRRPRFLVEFEAHVWNDKIEAAYAELGDYLTRNQIADTLIH